MAAARRTRSSCARARPFRSPCCSTGAETTVVACFAQRQNGAMRTAAVLSCLVVFGAAAACRVGDVEPTQLRGPMPQGIVVWPVLPEANRAPKDVFAGLDLAVRQRGYEVQSLAVGKQL